MDSEQQEKEYFNYYKCICGYKWVDIWTAMCDDRCGECGTIMTPYKSEEVEYEEEEENK